MWEWSREDNVRIFSISKSCIWNKMTVHCIYPSVTKFEYICIIFDTNIRWYHIRIYTNIFGYWFVSLYIWIFVLIEIILWVWRIFVNFLLICIDICIDFFVWIYLDIHLSEPFATKLQCLRGGSVLWGGEVLQCNDLCSHPAGCLLLPITSAQDWHPSDQTFVRVAFSTVFFCFCFIWKNAPTPQISWREAPQPSTTLSIWSFQLLQRIFILIHHLQLHLKREEYLEL